MRLLRADEACDQLGVSKPTLYKLIATGQLSTIRIGRSRRIPDSSIEEFIQRKLDEEATGVAG